MNKLILTFTIGIISVFVLTILSVADNNVQDMVNKSKTINKRHKVKH